MISRPAQRGVSPYALFGDQNLVPPADGQSPRKSAIGDVWEWFTAVDTAALPSNGIDTVVYQDGTVPAGNTIANSTGPTAFVSSYVIQPNFLTVGSVIRVRARGVFGTALAAATLRIQLLVGGVTMLAQTATAPPTGLVNAGWEFEADLIVTAIGAGGTWEAQGKLVLGNVSSGAAAGTPAGAKGADIFMLANIAAISRSTAASNSINLAVTWGTAAAANKITLREMTVDIIRP